MNKQRVWTEESIARAKAMRSNNSTVREIANACGVSLATAHRKVRNIVCSSPPKRGRKKKSNANTIIELRSIGMKNKDIAKKLGIHERTILKILNREA